MAGWATSSDAVLADLSGRLRDRRFFKSLGRRPDAPEVEARGRLEDALRAEGFDPAYYGAVDRVETDVYTEDDALVVLRFGHSLALLEASQVLRELSAEPFVHYRAFFPAEARASVRRALADLI